MLSFLQNNNKDNKFTKNKKKEKPSVTIIVPCWNEEKTIAGTVSSLLKLNYPKEKLKIHIVDDGSTDNTLKVAQEFKEEKQVKITHKENGGKHSAMNLALSQTNTDLIGCLDADSFVVEDALQQITKHFINNKNLTAVTPAIKIANTKTILGKIQKSEYLLSVFMRKVFAILDSIFVTPGPFSIMKTQVIKDVGGWKKAYNTEDMEMGIRLQKLGHLIENEPKAIVYTKAPTTLPKLYTQRVRWTYGFLRNAWDYRNMFFNKKYGNLGLFILPTAVFSIISIIFLLLIFLYRTFNFIMTELLKFSIIGLDIHVPSFDFFYINTTVAVFIIYITIGATLILMFFGKKLSLEKKMWSWDVPLYLALYGFIAPLWITGAFIKASLKIDTKWK